MKIITLQVNGGTNRGNAERPIYAVAAATLLRFAGLVRAAFRSATGAWMKISGDLLAAELTGSVRIAAV